MADAEGEPTYLLIRGGSFLKDNRLLPLGWRNDHPDAKAIAPRGTGGDPDFAAGFDTVTYEVRISKDLGALTVEVTLLYQTLGARYAAEIFTYQTPEIAEFRGYYAKADKRPITIWTTTQAVPAR